MQIRAKHILWLVAMLIIVVTGLWVVRQLTQIPLEHSVPPPQLEQSSTSSPLNTVGTSTHIINNMATSTEGLQHYRNEKFGIEFWYPEDWRISYNYYSVSYYSKYMLELTIPVTVKVGGTEETKVGYDSAFLLNIVLPEFVNTEFWRSQENTSNVTIAGVNGVKYEYEYEGFPHTAIIMPLGNLKMILATGDGNKPYMDEFNEIISSFKFFSPTAAI